MRIIAILPGFSIFFEEFKDQAPKYVIFRLEKAYSSSKGDESRLKLDIFNPKMLHKCPHALGDNSNPIDGHRCPSEKNCDGHRWD